MNESSDGDTNDRLVGIHSSVPRIGPEPVLASSCSLILIMTLS